MAWISTRRASGATDYVASHLSGSYLLHTMLRNVMLPLAELSQVHLVAMEIPAVAFAGFEHDLLKLVAKIQTVGPRQCVIVQPSLRKKTQRSLWVHRWNSMAQAPFRLHQTCSCKMGNPVPGCHFTYYVGADYAVLLEPCVEIPTLGASAEASIRALGGIMPYLFLKCSF